MREEDLLEQIANLSLDVMKEFEGRYPDELLELFTLVGKYMSISYCPPEVKEKVYHVTRSRYCPLCALREPCRRPRSSVPADCSDCVLRDTVSGRGCGTDYVLLRDAVRSGTPTEVAFHLGRAARALAKRTQESGGNIEDENIHTDTTKV